MFKPHKPQHILITLVVLTLVPLMTACNLPAKRTPTASAVALIYTSAAETVQAQATQMISTSLQPTLVLTTPSNASMTQIPSATLALPSATLQPSATQTAIRCDLVKFVSDVTIPDNTELSPGESFVKTWRLKNAGACTWTSSYILVYEGANLLNAPPAVQVTTATVPPGGEIEISVALTAPTVAGTYRGNFMLANGVGQKFGLGDGTKPFWAQIEVVAPTGIVFDFIARATEAEWKSGTGTNINTLLVFGGADDDANGVAKIKDGFLLENGVLGNKVLLTYPTHANNGVIAGTFPAYLVQGGDRLKTRLGFLANINGTCGAGKVIFEIHYKLGNTFQQLGGWEKSCDGKLLAVTIDLTSLKGKTIQIIFVVRADGAFTDDWAVWSSPRIER